MRTPAITFCCALAAWTVLGPPAASAQQGGMSVSECVQKEISAQAYQATSCTMVSARAKSPGISGKTRRASGRGCISATPGYTFIGAPNIERHICFGNRCRHDNPEIITNESDRADEICLTVHAWSESKPFGGGGSATYKICADVGRKATTDEVIALILRCEKNIEGSR